MKSLFLALLVGVSLTSQACEHPMGPVVVWPSDLSKQDLFHWEILGQWTAQTGESSIVIIFETSATKNKIYVSVFPENGNLPIAVGELSVAEYGFAGPIKLLYESQTENSELQALVYRSANGLRLQLKKQCDIAVDFNLVRRMNGETLTTQSISLP